MTQITHHTNKGARMEILPNRHALNQLAGNVQQRAINNYAKATPSIEDNGPNLIGIDKAKP